MSIKTAKILTIAGATGTFSRTSWGDIVKCSNATCILTLPDPATLPGREVVIYKTGGAGAITLTAAAGDTVDGAATNVEVDAQFDSMTLKSDGVSDWVITKKNIAP